MKRIVTIIMCITLVACNLCGCFSNTKNSEDSVINNVADSTEQNIAAVAQSNQLFDENQITDDDYEYDENLPNFTGLDDEKLHQYVEDNVLSEIEGQLSSDDYKIENIEVIYISKEYLEESKYNSKKNKYFGYDLAELDEQFDGKKYVFTLGDNNETIAIPLEIINDDTYKQVLKNVAIGTGVILVCVTVSIVTAGAGAPAAVSLIFAASAKTAAAFAVSSGIIGGVSAAAVKGYQTGDVEEAVKAGLLSGSNSFKWGAISGAIIGGAKEAYLLHSTKQLAAEEVAKAAVETTEKANNVTFLKTDVTTVPSPEEAEQIALQYYQPAKTQVAFLNQQEVSAFTPNSTRPDIIRVVNDHIEAIEVKRYDLSNPNSVTRLYSELERQITARAQNLPADATQRICLVNVGRDFPTEVVKEVISNLTAMFPQVPIDVIF